MTATRTRAAALLIAPLVLALLAVNLQGVQAAELDSAPSEDQCRPYIEKALKHLGAGSDEVQSSDHADGRDDDDERGDGHEDGEQQPSSSTTATDSEDNPSSVEEASSDDNDDDEVEQVQTVEITSVEDQAQEATSDEAENATDNSAPLDAEPEEDEAEVDVALEASAEQKDDEQSKETEAEADEPSSKSVEADEAEIDNEEAEQPLADEPSSKSVEVDEAESQNEEEQPLADEPSSKSVEVDEAEIENEAEPSTTSVEADEVEEPLAVEAEIVQENEAEAPLRDESGEEAEQKSLEEQIIVEEQHSGEEGSADEEASTTSAEAAGDAQNEEQEQESSPEEEELIMEVDIPEVLRPREHIAQLLKLDEDNEEKETAVEKAAEVVLRDLKRLYDNAIKPLEVLYKYRDLSNRHFGDPEIFSKPLVLFMGPWSGGKSSIINYLLDIEYGAKSLRTGAEPSPAYFNILMHGEEEEVLDGTQLAADWTFSGLQKFGQGLLDRLKGYKLNSKLLRKVNIVEIPGILEMRKQVQRLFPFNDACQWFIDRADIILLVYDPSKLDVGPETEAILDQLKGREYQTRIILNKADQVRPEELMRVQGALIWNISPLMSSAEPPVMYSASLWSRPYEAGAPTRLLYAQERAFLRDLRSAVDKRVEHKIASARRFAVRVRNHAKMVDCYLTTYYNHKSFFAKKKDVAERIIDSPQDYHIYEGLSTLTNISRYDLPDPDVYRDFFRLNNLYEFPLLSSTCTYFRGCPINRLDVAIAYDLPELVGKYKKAVEAAMRVQQVPEQATPTPTPAPAAAAAAPSKAKSAASTMSLS